jgi:hypothetical protein
MNRLHHYKPGELVLHPVRLGTSKTKFRVYEFRVVQDSHGKTILVESPHQIPFEINRYRVIDEKLQRCFQIGKGSLVTRVEGHSYK